MIWDDLLRKAAMNDLARALDWHGLMFCCCSGYLLNIRNIHTENLRICISRPLFLRLSLVAGKGPT